MTNERVAKLETEINDDLVTKMASVTKDLANSNQKIINLEKTVSQHATTLDNDKMTPGSNDVIINEIASIYRKVGKLEENKQQIETRIQTVEGLGTELKHLVDKVTQVETTTDINTLMLSAVVYGVYLTQYSKQKSIFKELNYYIQTRK